MARRPLVTAPNRIEWREVALPPEPPPQAVRIRSRLSLISPGTELRLLRGEPMMAGVWQGYADLDCPTIPAFDPRFTVAAKGRPTGPLYPVGLGYNTVGEVVAVGDGVAGIRAGDRVVCMARHQAAFDLPDWEAWPVPDAVPDDEAVFGYIATLGVAALRKARFGVGENVAVVGLGLVGLCAATVAHACGANLLCIDMSPTRVAHARAAFAGAVALEAAAPGLAEAIETAFAPHGVDVVLEAGAGRGSLDLAARIADRGGRVAVVALHPEELGPILGGEFNARQTEILGSSNDPYVDDRAGLPRFTLGGNVRYVLTLLAAGRISFRGVPSRGFPVAELAGAYAALARGDVEELAVLLTWDA